MTVGGQFDVNPTGAATYSIPIVVPPGTAGLAPSLSLNYSSQSGNGIVGFGWSLGGLPAIARCPQTFAQDNTHGSVNYDANDRFCLDGQRLLMISGSSYGADGSEYRTEIDSFSKIIAHNTAGVAGPGWFEVHTKSGEILELGNTTDSRIIPVPVAGHAAFTAARAWLANKISDTVGNYLKITYVNDATNGQYYPDHIVYTANDAAGLSPYNSVYFSYGTSDRGDVTPLYHAGSVMKTTKLLSDIKTYTNTTGTGTPVTDYKLVYQLGNAPYSQLTSVQRCPGSGACLPATTFTWQTASTWATRMIVDSTPALLSGGATSLWSAGDFNGDGIEDGFAYMAGVPGACAPLMLGNGAAGLVPANMTESFDGVPSQTACLQEGGGIFSVLGGGFGDLDGDGLTDMSVFTFTPGLCSCLLLNDGFGHFGQVGPDTSTQLGGPNDFNGDGRQDGYINDPVHGFYQFFYSQGDGTYQSSPTYPLPAGVAGGDFNGDGCTDLLTHDTTSIAQLSCNASTPSFQVVIGYSTYDYLIGDINGDGNSDFLTIPADTSHQITVNVSTGTSFLQSTISGVTCGGAPNCTPQNQFFVGDFDGDGKSDLLVIEPEDFKIYSWDSISQTLKLALTVTVELPQPGCANLSCTAKPGWNGMVQVADVDGDGCTDLVVWQPFVPTTDWYYKFGCHPPLLMTAISNGIGASTTITYDRLNKNDFYTKCTGEPGVFKCSDTAYPTQAVDGPIYVVKQVDSSNGIGGGFTSKYTYAGAKKDLHGRGFLGFQQIAVTDVQTNVTRTTSYNTLFPLTGTVTEQKTTVTGTNGTVVLSDTINSYCTVPGSPMMGTPTAVFLAVSNVTAANEVNNTPLPLSATSHLNSDGSCAYDAYGNPVLTIVTGSDGSSKTTVNTYSNNASTWIIGRLTNTTVTSVVGSSSITRNSSFGYLPNGVLNSEIIEPGSGGGCNGNNTSCTLDTEYTVIDAFGHPTTKVVSGAGFAARTTSVTYDTLGAFETSATNATGVQTEYFDFTGTYGASFGVPTGHTDLNGLITHWSYDSLGRRINETRPGVSGGQTDVSYAYCAGVAGGTAPCPANGAFVVQATPYNHGHVAQNGPITKTYYDALSRVIATDVQGYDGPLQTSCGSPCWIRTDTLYDGSGYVHQTSRPYFLTGGTQKLTTYDYTVPASGNQDPAGRAWKITAPDTSITTNAYTGLGSSGSQASVTNALTQTTTTAKNAQGLVSSVTNALGKVTGYVYDAYGDLLSVTDPLGNQIVNTYDIRGNKQISADPDMGNWSYTYDALSELLTQIDAKSQTTSLIYDALGRVKSRTEPDQTSTWTYDTAAHGVGMLQSATGSNAGYARTQFYDAQSRPSKTKLVINGTTYLYVPTYNADSRIDTLTYPSGFVVKYVYTALGYLYQLQDNVTGAVLWTANVRDAEMHLADQSAGNHTRTIAIYDPNTGLVQQIRASAGEADDGGVAHFDYTFDQIGNLTNRVDELESYAENFCYDPLNRLTAYAVAAPARTDCRAGRSGLIKTAAYDDIGDLTNKSDLAGSESGNYAYPTPGGGAGSHPHAVTSIAGSVNGVTDPQFKYDANGNLICEYTGSGCVGGGIVRETDAYWSANMTKKVTQGTSSVSFVYDSEHARITQAVANGTSTVTTTYLNDSVTGAMSEMVASGGTPTWNDYIMADGKLLGERTCTGTASGTSPCSGTTTAEYFVLDHLQSVAVVTDGTTGSPAYGNVTARESFDAWGRQRNPDGSDDPTCALGASSPNTRRFTGQEHIDTMCLINLNARLYDPTIGRFMAADSMVPDPTDGQSYNRYTYVDNRPLSFTDPTGHLAGDLFSDNIGDDPDRTHDPDWHPEISCSGNCPAGSWSSQAQSSGDPGKKLATPKGNVQFAPNSDGATAQSFDKDGNGANGTDSPSLTQTVDGTTWVTKSYTTAPSQGLQADGEDPMPPAIGTRGTATDANGVNCPGCIQIAANGTPQVQLNRAQHEACVECEIQRWQKAGFIVTRNVSFLDPRTGLRIVADYVVSSRVPDPDSFFGFTKPEPLFVRDVKTGDGRLTQNQTEVYPYILHGGEVIPVGMRAYLAGFEIGEPTTIRELSVGGNLPSFTVH